MPSPIAGLSIERARRFDDYLDGLVAGAAVPRLDVDPALAAVARRLHAAAAAVPAGLATGTHSAIVAAPTRVATSRRRVGGGLRRGWAGLHWGATALLLLTLFGATFAVASRQAARQGDAAPDFDLYREDRFGQILSPLDPLTLADVSSVPSPLATSDPHATPGVAEGVLRATSWYGCIGEPDILRIDFLETVNDDAEIDLTYVIRNGRTGQEIAPVNHLVNAAFITDVSDDCDRLVLSGGEAGQPRWYVYETATGKQVASAAADNLVPIGGLGSLDPTGRRLYLLVFGGDEQGMTASYESGPDPSPVRVASIDLDTGAVVTSADLPGVLAGHCPASHRCELQGQISIGPRLVVSPDGSTIAVVAGDTASVVLLDAADLSVIRSIDMPGGGSATPNGGSAAAGVTTASREATQQEVGEAGPDGNRVPPKYRDLVEDYFSNPSDSVTVNAEARAVFAPDGRSLYVSGYEAMVGPDGEFGGARHYPLRRLDLETGQVGAIAPDGANQLVPSPDGRWFYALGTSPEFPATCDGCPQTLRRLDGETLATEAERTLPAGWHVLILPPRDA